MVDNSVIFRQLVNHFASKAAIARRDGQSLIHQCGAVIISRYHVLTAAHCIYRLRPREFVVVIGNYNRDSRSPDEQVFDVDQRFIHERFSCELSLSRRYDIRF